MAWPFVFESNFERGTTAEWDSETTDTLNRLNIRHYSHLARYSTTLTGGIAPWRGAYCMEILLGGETDAHQLIEGDLNIADTETAWTRFYIFISKDFDATADDIFNIYEFNSAAAVERAVSLRYTAATDVINIGIGKVAGTVWGTQNLERGRWYCVEATATIQTGGTGTGEVFLDGTSAAAITTLTDLAVTTGSLGTKNVAATTSGYLFFDQFVYDDLRIYPHSDRYPDVMQITKSQHICLGESELLNVTLINGNAATNVLKIYDTDEAIVTDDTNIVAHLHNLTALEPPIDLADVPVCVKRGAYVQLAVETADNTQPRALIHIGRSQGYRSHGRVRQHGAVRTKHRLATQ